MWGDRGHVELQRSCGTTWVVWGDMGRVGRQGRVGVGGMASVCGVITIRAHLERLEEFLADRGRRRPQRARLRQLHGPRTGRSHHEVAARRFRLDTLGCATGRRLRTAARRDGRAAQQAAAVAQAAAAARTRPLTFVIRAAKAS